MRRFLAGCMPDWLKAAVRGILGRPGPGGLRDAEQRRLRRLPRRTAGAVDVYGRRVAFVDAASFLSAHGEIFIRKIYSFAAAGTSPRIIDGGANIGLASLFFKRLYPDCRLTAVEPDPLICGVLRENLGNAGWGDVAVIEGALWHTEELLYFTADQSDAGRLEAGGGTGVRGVRLSDLIGDSRVDLLKLDIEGAEFVVLTEAASHLSLVDRVFVEWHSQSGEEQNLGEVLGILARAGFRYYVETASVFHRNPFVAGPDFKGDPFDHLLNIYAWRTA